MLNRLIDYTHKHVPFSELGFTVRDIRWRIELAKDGQLMGVLPMGDEKSGAERWHCPEMHDMQSGGKSHFLIDNLKTAILLKAVESDKPRHAYYVQRIREAAIVSPMLEALTVFLGDASSLDLLRQKLLAAPYRAGPTENLEWRIDGRDPLADPDILEWLRRWRVNDRDNASDENLMICFATGETIVSAKTHPKIMGLPGGQGAGDALIGFDKAAFTSLGLKKSDNAAVSEQAARSYVDALNHLKRHHGKRLGESLVLHWFKSSVAVEDDLLPWFQDPPEVAAASAAIEARKLLNSIRSGQRPDLADNEFYALTISGMSGRVMVRDWMEGSFETLVSNVADWFDHLAIAARDGNGFARDPKFMAVCGALVRELKDLPAPTAATLWKVALQRLPIPQPLMAQALARFRTDLVDKDQPVFNHARMGLIKAYFVRLNSGENQTMTAYLNREHPEPAYHCGRLLAIFSNLQYAALGDVGAGVVQRFYAAASQTPGLIIGRLTSNARNHLGKLEGGLAHWYENQIADVMGRLGDGAPRILDLNGQGLFALGYYQQLAALRERKKTNDTTKQGETK